MERRLLTLSVYSDGNFPFVVKINESRWYTSEVALSHAEAHELWVLLSQQFQPKRAKRKGAKK